jgi:trehalose 6-phosphate synthase
LPRLILVSNRVAVPDPKGPRQAGGLAIAVNAALKRREGIWFGWSGRVSEDSTGLEPAVVESAQRTYITLDLSPSDFREYYNGFANRVLWADPPLPRRSRGVYRGRSRELPAGERALCRGVVSVYSPG